MIRFLKNVFRNLFAYAREITLSGTLLVMFLATILMVVGAYFYPHNFSPYYGYGVESMDFDWSVAEYFDLYVRNGAFKIVYFLLVSLLTAWLAKLAVVKLFRKPAPRVRGTIILLIAGVAVSLLLYPLPPYYSADLSVFDLDSFVPNTETPVKDSYGYEETNAEFCGKQIDFFFSPYEGYSIKAFSVVQSLEAQISIPVNYQCLPDATRLNENIMCEKNHGVKYSKESERLMKDWHDGGLFTPAITLGCKYTYKGIYSVEVYKELICRDLGVCE